MKEKDPTLCHMNSSFVGYKLQLKVKTHVLYSRRSYDLYKHCKLWDDKWTYVTPEKLLTKEQLKQVKLVAFDGKYGQWPQHLVAGVYPIEYLTYVGSYIEFINCKLEYRIIPVCCQVKYEETEILDPIYPANADRQNPEIIKISEQRTGGPDGELGESSMPTSSLDSRSRIGF